MATSSLGTANGAGIARRRLQSLAEGLSTLDLEAEVDQAARLLRAELPTLPDYDQLDADHQAYYDIATGLRAAMILLTPSVLAATHGLSKLKEGDEEKTFAVPDHAERGRWAEEVAQAIGYLVKLVRGMQPRPRRPFSVFGAAGVARQRSERRYSEGDILRLLVPEGWYYDSAFGGTGFGLEEL